MQELETASCPCVREARLVHRVDDQVGLAITDNEVAIMATLNTIPATRTICAVMGSLLLALGHEPAMAQAASRMATGTDVANQRSWYDSVEAYKYDAAKHVVRKNQLNTFIGRLPPMLPAVVVLVITVDETGRPIEVEVQRSPDDEATAVAIASIYHAGSLPRPLNLAAGPERLFTYSETFLFNADYRFQMRTLAPRQGNE